MSWSVQKCVGAPDKVIPVVTADFDTAHKPYAGTDEGADIESAKDMVLSWLLTVPAGRAAIVEASGSRGKEWVRVHVDCSTVALL